MVSDGTWLVLGVLSPLALPALIGAFIALVYSCIGLTKWFRQRGLSSPFPISATPTPTPSAELAPSESALPNADEVASSASMSGFAAEEGSGAPQELVSSRPVAFLVHVTYERSGFEPLKRII
jgi:hypothetical protein